MHLLPAKLVPWETREEIDFCHVKNGQEKIESEATLPDCVSSGAEAVKWDITTKG
jgi:hypothetical protein